MKENLNMQGHLNLWLTDRSGQVVMRQSQHNRIVKSGRQLVAQLFTGTTGVPIKISHIGVGMGSDSAADSQTALIKERSPRKAITATTFSDFVEQDLSNPRLGGTLRVKVSVSAEYDFGEGNGVDPLQEAAIFTADTGGVMYNRVVFDPVIKSGAFKLSLLWEILF